MNKLVFNEQKEFFLPNYNDTVGSLMATVSGLAITEIKALTTDDLSKVQITTDSGTLIAEFSHMTMGESISYNSTFDQTTFELIKNGVSEINSQIVDLQSQIKELQDVIAEQQVMLTSLASNGATTDDNL